MVKQKFVNIVFILVIITIVVGVLIALQPKDLNPIQTRFDKDPMLVYACQNEIWLNTSHIITINRGIDGVSEERVNIYKICYFRDGHTENSYIGMIKPTMGCVVDFMESRGENPWNSRYVFK
jgi:hypothetical protein